MLLEPSQDFTVSDSHSQTLLTCRESKLFQCSANGRELVSSKVDTETHKTFSSKSPCRWEGVLRSLLSAVWGDRAGESVQPGTPAPGTANQLAILWKHPEFPKDQFFWLPHPTLADEIPAGPELSSRLCLPSARITDTHQHPWLPSVLWQKKLFLFCPVIFPSITLPLSTPSPGLYPFGAALFFKAYFKS